MSFPAMVYIDDKCDACGAKGRMGVSWGFEAPVLCVTCLALGATACARYNPDPLTAVQSSALLRRRRTALEPQ